MSFPWLDAALRDITGGELKEQRVDAEAFARAVLDCPADRFVRAAIDSIGYLALDGFE